MRRLVSLSFALAAKELLVNVLYGSLKVAAAA